MGSGFLLAIVLGLWGIVLYPTLAKNRINTNETKSIDRFNKAMRSISDLVPTRNSEVIDNQRSAALRRRNVTYTIFVSNVAVIVTAFLGYIPEYVSFFPVGILLMWLIAAFVAAQKIETETKVKPKSTVIRKNYVIYKKPVEPKTLIKPDPERDLIMDERPLEKIEEPKVVLQPVAEEQRRAQGA
jgi:hypothetical protein